MITSATQHLLPLIDPELLFVQVLIQRTSSGYSLRHEQDRAKPHEDLRLVKVEELRDLSKFNQSMAFRPLKCSPDLILGWVADARDPEELERALEVLYPGCVTDWHASNLPHPPVTHFREFAGRQSGMYRIANLLSDASAEQVSSSCCDACFCLRRRLWTIGTLGPDPKDSKSLAPCLEPCAILLELARKAMRLEQEEKTPMRLAAEEWRSVMEALERLQHPPSSQSRAGDVADPTNPRRLRLLLEKLKTPGSVEAPPPKH